MLTLLLQIELLLFWWSNTWPCAKAFTKPAPHCLQSKNQFNGQSCRILSGQHLNIISLDESNHASILHIQILTIINKMYHVNWISHLGSTHCHWSNILQSVPPDHVHITRYQSTSFSLSPTHMIKREHHNLRSFLPIFQAPEHMVDIFLRQYKTIYTDVKWRDFCDAHNAYSWVILRR